jgi:hypothetical protein
MGRVEESTLNKMPRIDVSGIFAGVDVSEKMADPLEVFGDIHGFIIPV